MEIGRLGLKTPRRLTQALASLGLASIFGQACASNEETFETVAHVELSRFMGDWRVQGHTPLLIDNNSSNQVERYELKEDGEISTTYTFQRGGRTFTLHPKGKVENATTNAHWKMQFLWPFESDYMIIRLAPDYSYTVVSVPDRQSIWIMSRAVQMPENLYRSIVDDLKKNAYPVEKIRRVPQDLH